MITSELCGHCMAEGEYELPDSGITKCKGCGADLVLCSACTRRDGQCTDCKQGNKFELWYD